MQYDMGKLEWGKIRLKYRALENITQRRHKEGGEVILYNQLVTLFIKINHSTQFCMLSITTRTERQHGKTFNFRNGRVNDCCSCHRQLPCTIIHFSKKFWEKLYEVPNNWFFQKISKISMQYSSRRKCSSRIGKIPNECSILNYT